MNQEIDIQKSEQRQTREVEIQSRECSARLLRDDGNVRPPAQRSTEPRCFTITASVRALIAHRL